MNEDTELWAAYKEQQKQERAKRRASAEQQLKDRGVNYTVHNEGAHIVIEEGGATFDFWPGSTRWRMRPQRSDFGVHKLFQAITQRRLVSMDFSKLEERVIAHMGVDEALDHYGTLAYVDKMEKAYPHLKGEAT